jgi:hypothetical protein
MRAGGETWDRVVITAVGETGILGRAVAIKRGAEGWQDQVLTEKGWTLAYRDWRKVEGGEVVSEPEKGLTIDEALKILNDNKHDGQTWKAWLQGSCVKLLTPFEAVAIAREYLRLEKGVKP